MNQMYGFEGEVKAKYTTQMFQLFTEVFNYLPLSHCINNKVLVGAGVHARTHIVYFSFLGDARGTVQQGRRVAQRYSCCRSREATARGWPHVRDTLERSSAAKWPLGK